MRPGLELDLYLGTLSPFGLPTLCRVRCLASAALGDSPIKDDLDAAVRSEALTEVRIQVGMLTGDDKQGPPHLSLCSDGGELRLTLGSY